MNSIGCLRWINRICLPGPNVRRQEPGRRAEGGDPPAEGQERCRRGDAQGDLQLAERPSEAEAGVGAGRCQSWALSVFSHFLNDKK